MPRESVPLTLADGKAHSLRYDFNALVALEDVGLPIDKLGDIMKTGTSIKTLRAVLWAGLLHENKDLTIEEAGALIDIATLGAFTDGIVRAMNVSMPATQGEPKKKPGPRLAIPGTSKSS